MARHRSRTGAPLDGASVEEVGRNHPSSHSEASAAYRIEFSRPLSDWLAEQRPGATTGRILDFGCADLLLARRLDGTWLVDGYDEWASAREAARATLARLEHPGVVHDRLADIPTGAYDAVVLNSLFQYVPPGAPAEELLAPIVALLAPGASIGIVITDVVSEGANPAIDLVDAVRYAVEREGVLRAPARVWEGIQSGKPAKRQRMPERELAAVADRLGLVLERHPRNLSRFTRRATFVLRPAPAATPAPAVEADPVVDVDPGDLVPAPAEEVVRVALRDPGAAAQLAEQGYARLGPLLSPEEVAEANEVFAEASRRLDAPIGDRWFPTILLPDDDVRAYITAELSRLIVPHLERHLDPATLELVRLDYSVKPSSPESELGPHQDFTLVDERTAQSLYLWIPLCDTDERNGTLHVVPGSHRFGNRIRSRHVPSVFDEVLDEVHERSVRLDCRAGELIVMVSGVVHWSPPNASGELRLAAHGIVKPAGVPLVFYYLDEQTPADQVECYELDIERYVRAIHEGRPAEAAAPDRLERRPPGSMSPERFAAGIAALEAGPPS